MIPNNLILGLDPQYVIYPIQESNLHCYCASSVQALRSALARRTHHPLAGGRARER